MNPLEDSFVFQDLLVYPAGSGPNAYCYLPRAPRPETDAEGRPTLMLIPMGKGGFLQFGVNLGYNEDTLDPLRKDLIKRLGLTDPVQLKLDLAPLQVVGARFQIVPGKGEFVDVAKSDTSGFPPYAALFHVQLDTQQQAATTAALNGRAGFLQVRYDASLPFPVTVTARIMGDVRDVLDHLMVPDTCQDMTALALALLESAITQGKLAMSFAASGRAPDDLSRRATVEAKANLAALLIRSIHGDAVLPDTAQAEASATLSDVVEQPLDLVTDLATWFDQAGAAHIVMPPGGRSPS